jgi:protein-tyrosine phosphatase
MTDMVDLHCHLLAGLDDGPRSLDDALAMSRMLSEQGVGRVAALAHQCERWGVRRGAICEAVAALRRRLEEEAIPLCVHPAAEVMASPDLPAAWAAGRLVSLGDHGRFLLVEMPNGLFVDLRPAVRRLGQMGVRVVLAHPERHPELLHEPGAVEELIRLGALVQVSSASVTDPKSKEDARALRGWLRRGCVHFLGSDGHSPRKRQPLLAAAARRVREWAGEPVARAVCRDNGERVLTGQPLTVAPPRAERRWWAIWSSQ